VNPLNSKKKKSKRKKSRRKEQAHATGSVDGTATSPAHASELSAVSSDSDQEDEEKEKEVSAQKRKERVPLERSTREKSTANNGDDGGDDGGDDAQVLKLIRALKYLKQRLGPAWENMHQQDREWWVQGSIKEKFNSFEEQSFEWGRMKKEWLEQQARRQQARAHSNQQQYSKLEKWRLQVLLIECTINRLHY
jgi:hypothetical protein